MTIEELRKAITEKYDSQITIGERKLTEDEKSICINSWVDGYLEGIVNCAKYSITHEKEATNGVSFIRELYDNKDGTRSNDLLKPVHLSRKGEENDHHDN